MNPFDRSSVIITGGGRSIGREIALRFAAESSHALFLIGRNREKLSETAEECRRAGAEKVAFASCDLTDRKAVDGLQLPPELPNPGVLVNNAGNFLLRPLGETSAEEFLSQWQLHAYAPFLLIRKWLPDLKACERALVVNISSASATRGRERSGAYSSSKHALLGLTRSLRLELRESRVAVTAINPGQTWSDSWSDTDADPHELIDPKDLAALILQLCRFSPRTVAEEILLAPQRGERKPD